MKYQENQKIIEAEQWFPKKSSVYVYDFTFIREDGKKIEIYEVNTNSGWITIFPGDYIITNIDNNKCVLVMLKESFENKYIKMK